MSAVMAVTSMCQQQCYPPQSEHQFDSLASRNNNMSRINPKIMLIQLLSQFSHFSSLTFYPSRAFAEGQKSSVGAAKTY